MTDSTIALQPKAQRELLEIAERIEGRSVEDHIDPWPHVDGKPLEYQPAGLAEEIAQELMGRLNRFAFLHDFTVDCVYRNVEKWEKKGRTVFGELRTATGLLGYYSDAHFIMRVNFPVWMAMNPWQRVALVYHELRHATMDDKGNPGTVGHDAELFFDEVEIFGTETYAQWRSLAERVEAGRGVNVQYHMQFEEEAAAGAGS